MTLQSDCSVGIKKETTYGTAVTVDRFLEFTDEKFTVTPEYIQGEGLRVGKVLPRSGRRALSKTQCEGDWGMEWQTKGMGVLLEAMLGSNTSTLRSGVIYQQLAVPAATDPMPSYTIQKGIPPVGGGATLPHTFDGMVCDSWEIGCEKNGFVTLSTSWKGQEMATATVYAAPSYSTAPANFTFAQGSFYLGVNGTSTLTVPTATALGSTTATASANITKWKLKGENAVDDGGFVFGSAGKRGRRPVYGMRKITGSFSAEFDAATIRDYFINQSSLHQVITFVSDQLVNGSTYATLQVVLPEIRLEGDIPNTNKGDLIEIDCGFTVLDGESAAQPIYIVAVTADTAI